MTLPPRNERQRPRPRASATLGTHRTLLTVADAIIAAAQPKALTPTSSDANRLLPSTQNDEVPTTRANRNQKCERR